MKYLCITQFVVPYEWAYGVLLRAAEIARDPEFGLRLWRGNNIGVNLIKPHDSRLH